MRSWSRPPSRSRAFAFALAAASLAPPSAPASALQAAIEPPSIVVVASANVPVENLTLTELRRVFLLERRYWKPGQPATVLYPAPGSPAREWLLRNLSRGSEQDLRRLMLEKMYRGDIDLAPKVTDSDQEAVAFVASGSGLLALVPASAAEGAAVKVLRLDGHRPGGVGYPQPE